MKKLLLGGSPCTYWSIARTKGRETTSSGLGWELFENYVVALNKFKPDYFLYENNKSISKDIQAEITRYLGVKPICINSSLVSAQNRERLYWVGFNVCGNYKTLYIPQPENLNITLDMIIENGLAYKDKSNTLCSNYKPSIGQIVPGHYDRTMIAIPVNMTSDNKDGIRNLIGNTVDRKTCVAFRSFENANAYFVKDGKINIRGNVFSISLPDGCYTFRKLTVNECKKLQTVPDWYKFPVSDSQAYKMLGNGWTISVIKHIINFMPNIYDDELDVLSMYDGMACGHIAITELGLKLARYRATEIDKYAIKTAKYNFDDIEELGNAYCVYLDNIIF